MRKSAKFPKVGRTWFLWCMTAHCRYISLPRNRLCWNQQDVGMPSKRYLAHTSLTIWSTQKHVLPFLYIFNFIFWELKISSLCIGLWYRPPANYTALDNLHSVMESLDATILSSFVLLGNFNIDFCNQRHPLFCKLTSFFYTVLYKRRSFPTLLTSASLVAQHL